MKWFSAFLKFKRRLSKLSQVLVHRFAEFSRKHQNSKRLPMVLFILLIIDGFIAYIPSVVLLIVSVVISVRRWILFGSIFSIACTFNNFAAYFIGRWVSPDTLVWFIEKFNLEGVWHLAERSLHNYGPFATFMGAIIGLPTQIIMVLLGIADTHLMADHPGVSSALVSAMVFSLAGHTIKGLGVAWFARMGWLKIEEKFDTPELSASRGAGGQKTV